MAKSFAVWILPVSFHDYHDYYYYRAEGAFRLKQIAHSVSKKVGPTGYTDIYIYNASVAV